MESDPYLALAADSRKYGNVHQRRYRGSHHVQEKGVKFRFLEIQNFLKNFKPRKRRKF